MPETVPHATEDQARELLQHIDGVTTRGHPLMNRFFFVEEHAAPPPGSEKLFPALDQPERYDRVGFGIFFSHRFDDSVLGDHEDLATLSFSSSGYRGDQVAADASVAYQIYAPGGRYRLEQKLSYESPPKQRGRMFRIEDTEEIAAYEAQLDAEITAERAARDEERDLGLLAVSHTTADDLISFAKRCNPHA
jgi:hypothetical protein